MFTNNCKMSMPKQYKDLVFNLWNCLIINGLDQMILLESLLKEMT